MFILINGNCEREWLKQLADFPEQDVYYLPAYNRICMTYDDGHSYAAYYQDEKGKVFYPFLVREISSLPWLNSPKEWIGYKDIITPYGYGGPLINCQADVREEVIDSFRMKFEQYCRENNIISEFIRFHPLLDNHLGYAKTKMSLEFNRFTIAMDLQIGPEKIFNNMAPTCRNRIKKAQKSGLQVDFSNTENDLEDFVKLYYLTMTKHFANKYYFFNQDYFRALKKQLCKNFILANARLKGRTVASAIMFYNGSIMSYHLGGSDPQELNLAPNNLLFYQLACLGADKGFKYLHLGGGHRHNDSLFRFKKNFNPNGLKEFWIGRQIHLIDAYKKLASLWEDRQSNFNKNLDYFPVYRSE